MKRTHKIFWRVLPRQDERMAAVFPGEMQDGFVEGDEYQTVMDGQTEPALPLPPPMPTPPVLGLRIQFKKPASVNEIMAQWRPGVSNLSVRATMVYVIVIEKRYQEIYVEQVPTGFTSCGKTREKKLQISPLRYAPVEMTNLLGDVRPLSAGKTAVYPKRICHLDRSVA